MKTGLALLAALAGLCLVASPNGWSVSVGLLTFLAGMAVVCRSLARPSGDHDVTPGPVDPPPAGSGVTYHPRTLHLVSARPGVGGVQRLGDPENVPVRAAADTPARTGTAFVAFLDRHLVRLCVTLIAGLLVCLVGALVRVAGW